MRSLLADRFCPTFCSSLFVPTVYCTVDVYSQPTYCMYSTVCISADFFLRPATARPPPLRCILSDKAQKLCVQKWSYEYRDVSKLLRNSQNCVHRCSISVLVKKNRTEMHVFLCTILKNRTLHKGCTTVQLLYCVTQQLLCAKTITTQVLYCVHSVHN